MRILDPGRGFRRGILLISPAFHTVFCLPISPEIQGGTLHPGTLRFLKLRKERGDPADHEFEYARPYAFGTTKMALRSVKCATVFSLGV